MEHIFVSNGTTQLVLVPENELDKLLLNRILGEGPVEIDYIRQPVSILGKSVNGGIIIRKQTSYDTSEAQTLPQLQADEAHLEGSW